MRPSILVMLAVAIGVTLLGILIFRDRSFSRIQQEGTIRIGYAVEAPYAYLLPNGEVSGESPEIARLVASRLGIQRIEWRQVEFDELIRELEEGRIDLIASGMFVTESRRERVRFSIPTYHVRPGLLVARGNPCHLQSYKELARHQKLKVAVLAGAVEGEMLLRLGVTKGQLVQVPDALTALKALETGGLQAIVLSEPTVRWMAAHSETDRTEAVLEPEIAGEVPTDAYGQAAFAFRRNDRALQQAWNKVLSHYLGSQEHRALLKKLGFIGAPVCLRTERKH